MRERKIRLPILTLAATILLAQNAGVAQNAIEKTRVLIPEGKGRGFLDEIYANLSAESQEVTPETDATLLEPFSPLDGESGPFAVNHFSSVSENFEWRNLDLLVIGANRACIEYIRAWPAPNQFLVNKTASLALTNALKIGDLDEADSYWPLVKTLDFKGVPAEKVYECYPNLLKQLVWAGRIDEAEFLARKLTAKFNGKRSDYIDSYKYIEPRHRQPVLKVCAQVLAIRSPKEANILVDQLFELGMDNLWLGDFCTKLGKAEQAEACYKRLKLAEERRGSVQKYLIDVRPPAAIEKNELKPQPQFELLTSINEAIKSGSPSNVAIAELLELYKKAPKQVSAERPPLNYYCALLSVARKLSDKKLYDQSDDLLNKIATIAPDHEATLGLNIFTTAEIAINAERRGKDTEAGWAKLKSKINRLDRFTSNNFRYVALAYGSAGQYDRAEAVLQQATLFSDAEIAQKQNVNGQILLLLDKANLQAAQGQYEQSEACFKLAIDRFKSYTPSSAVEAQYPEILDSKIMTKVITLARTNIANKQSPRAEQELHKLMELNWPVGKNSNYAGVNQAQLYSLSPINVELARLHYARGEFKEALALLNKTSTSWDNSFGELCLLQADCASADKDWPTAFTGYMTAPFQGQSLNPSNYIPGFTEFCLKKALEASTHIAAPDAAKLSALYQALGQVYEMAPYDPDIAQKYYRKAFETCPDNSSEKANLAAKIAVNERSAAFFKFEERTRDGIKPKASDQASIHSPAAIKMLIESAEFGEKNNSDDRAILWFTVALAEIECKEIDSAIAHTKHGIDLIYRLPYQEQQPRTLELGGALKTIALSGRVKEAEELSQAAIDRTSLLFGPNSFAVEMLQSELFSLYRQIKEYDKALAVLDQILARDQNKRRYKNSADDNGKSNIVPGDLSAIKDEKEKAFYLTVLNKYLAAYRKYGPADSSEVAQTLTQIADLESEGDLEGAIANYRSALAITKLFGEVVHCGTVVDKLESLLRKHKREAEALQIESDSKSFYAEVEGLNLDLNGNVQEIAEEQKKRIAFMQKEIPYGDKTKGWLYQSISACDKSGDIAEVNRLAPIILSAFNHSPEPPLYSDLSGWHYIGARCRLYKLIISANIKHGDLETAKKWLKLALADKLDLPSLQEIVFLGEMELACGNRNAALVFYESAKAQYRANIDNYIDSELEALARNLSI
ncbi:hypothetical protein BH11CYA1_BH11CYA1_11810 [soil metagenome]